MIEAIINIDSLIILEGDGGTPEEDSLMILLALQTQDLMRVRSRALSLLAESESRDPYGGECDACYRSRIESRRCGGCLY